MAHNGVLFFDTQVRPKISLYTDASLQGLGGFFYENSDQIWSETTATIQQKNAFAVPIPQSAHINIHELEAILIAMKMWSKCWYRAELVLYTDSTNAFNGLKKLTLHEEANTPLREILLLAAEQDIQIIPR